MLHAPLLTGFRIFLILSCSIFSVTAKTTLQKTPTSQWHATFSAQERAARKSEPSKKEAQSIDLPTQQIKEWNIFVYIAGNNNLYSFIQDNLAQMLSVGSTSMLNLVVQIDKFGSQDVTRALVQKGGLDVYWRASNTPPSERANQPARYNSGSLENFVDFIKTGLDRFKARKNCVIIWNHGSGIIDPNKWRLLSAMPQGTRGMAFNDNYGYYLSSQDLTAAFSTISRDCLNGQPIDVLGLDICCGGQLEIASQVKEYVRFMVGSQEVELASGWDYSRLLKNISMVPCTALEFATSIVGAYKDTYINKTSDYTLSVFDLSKAPPEGKTTYFQLLEQSLSSLASTLITLLRSSYKSTVRQIISDIRKKKNTCCDFYCNEYIDLHLFIVSLQSAFRQLLNNQQMALQNPLVAASVQQATSTCSIILDAIYKVIPVYTAGQSFAGNPIRSRGISIAFPTRVIYPSYFKTAFAQQYQWLWFLKEFLGP